jgi:hypothetical protein
MTRRGFIGGLGQGERQVIETRHGFTIKNFVPIRTKDSFDSGAWEEAEGVVTHIANAPEGELELHPER